MLRLLLRFHREEDAQMSFLGVAGALCFAALLGMVVNTNQVVAERVKMQDVADVTALSTAAWTARGLNTVSFINVMNTKLISTAILLNALKDALPVIEQVGRVQQAIFNACSGVPIIGGFCIVAARVVEAQLYVLRGLKTAVDKAATRLSACPSGLLWKTMKALETTATGVQKSFPAIGFIEAVGLDTIGAQGEGGIAAANGATFGIVFNGAAINGNVTEALQLPLKQEGFDRHCPFVVDGGRGYELQGYDQGDGPLKVGRERIKDTLLLPWITMFSGPIFSGMVTKHSIDVGCTNRVSDNETINVQLTTLDECRQYGKAARWAQVWYQSDEIDRSDLVLGDFVPWVPRNTGGGDRGDEQRELEEARRNLGDINIPGAPAGDGSGGSNVTAGDGYQIFEGERSGSNAVVGCGSGLPSYFDLGDENLGTINPFVCGASATNCRRIDQVTRFQWYNSKHTRFTGSSPREVGGYYIRMHREVVERDEEPDQYRYLVEVIALASAGETEMTQEQFQEYLNKKAQELGVDGNVDMSGSNSSQGCGNNQKPNPWILDTADRPKFDDRMRFIAVVYKEVDQSDPPYFWSRFFDERPPRYIIAYSQAQVYNRLEENTFTQDWRVRLERASLLERIIDKLPGGLLTDQARNMLSVVNNH